MRKRSSVNGWFVLALLVLLGLSDSMYRGLWRLFSVQVVWLGLSVLAFALRFLIPRFYAQYLKDIARKNAKSHKKKASKTMAVDKATYETEVQPLYQEAKTLFSQLLKTQQLSREDILNLKIIIDNNLGVFSDYYRNYRFENDAKEIYVKMKNFNLSKSNYQEILAFLKAKIQN